ncbi:hypothetical protein crov032 [Cafeteria roenbergensis virus]|uniref:Uncharacterized protein n=1 Tax=Cafeteria roenbergensis virus (strain BV-PW1) TaxID=693272 RepID=E3T4F2_CROVB|nr:hypothetical protein crov032 [Cafeteria roenbergensis virus BV-PW1]ADO67065.1 hypothetical protein crov032 [Cafeteria roenbergensis virus BV-PW1]
MRMYVFQMELFDALNLLGNGSNKFDFTFTFKNGTTLFYNSELKSWQISKYIKNNKLELILKIIRIIINGINLSNGGCELEYVPVAYYNYKTDTTIELWRLQLPNSLTHLTFGFKFYQEITENVLPTNLKVLKIYYGNKNKDIILKNIDTSKIKFKIEYFK